MSFKVFRIIVDTLLPDVTEIELVLDDTLNDHVGKKIFGAGFQHDGNAPKTGRPIGYGVCFVIIGVVVRLPGISERVFCLPYAARLWWPQKAKVKPLGKKHRSKSELGAELIRLTRSWIDSSVTLRVIVDGGYSNRQIIQDRPKGVHITGKVRMDAALYALATQETNKRGRPRKKGDRLPCPKSIFIHEGDQWEWVWITLYGQETIVCVHRFEAIWYKAAGNEPLSIVMVHDPAHKYPDTVFFDTDAAASDYRDYPEIQPSLEYRDHQSGNQEFTRQCRPAVPLREISHSHSAHGILELLLRGGLVRQSVPQAKRFSSSPLPPGT